MAESITEGFIRTEKCSVITFSDEVNAIDVRNYLIEAWPRLTKNLENATMLFISGVHGSEDGQLGDKSDGCEEMQNQVSTHQYPNNCVNIKH